MDNEPTESQIIAQAVKDLTELVRVVVMQNQELMQALVDTLTTYEVEEDEDDDDAFEPPTLVN